MFTNIAIAEEVPQTVESVVVVEEPTSGFLSFAQDSTLMNFAPLVLIFLIFYFLLIRPQVKKQKVLLLPQTIWKLDHSGLGMPTVLTLQI